MKHITLSNNEEAIVDDENYEMLSKIGKWQVSGGYAVHSFRNKNGKATNIAMHRLINKTPLGLVTDHINGNRLDNRSINLRTVTQAQNRLNIPKSSLNTSGYKGVTWRKDISKWQASIRINGIKTHLGHFSDVRKAAKVYANASLEYHKGYANLKTIEEAYYQS